MPNDWHRAPFGPRSDFDVRIALADQIDSSGRKVIDDRNADVLLNGGINTRALQHYLGHKNIQHSIR